jgi:hypothetical protein
MLLDALVHIHDHHIAQSAAPTATMQIQVLVAIFFLCPTTSRVSSESLVLLLLLLLLPLLRYCCCCCCCAVGGAGSGHTLSAHGPTSTPGTTKLMPERVWLKPQARNMAPGRSPADLLTCQASARASQRRARHDTTSTPRSGAAAGLCRRGRALCLQSSLQPSRVADLWVAHRDW